MATAEVPYPRAMARWPTLRQSLLGSFDLCPLEVIFEMQHRYVGGLDDPDRIQWSKTEQARGTIAHRWAGKVLHLLAATGNDALADEVECPKCGLHPNDSRSEGEEPFYEGNACPECDTSMVTKPLNEVALGLLADVLLQDDQIDVRNVVSCPQHEIKDLTWVVCKFAREQRFHIGNLVSVEERLGFPVAYPDGKGGQVERMITGQLDVLFGEPIEDMPGKLHATVIDWKFTWAIPGASSISNEGYWQQLVYAFLVLKRYTNVERVTLNEVYPYFSPGESGEENCRKATLSRKDLPWLERRVATVAMGFDRMWEAYEVERELRAEWDGEEEMRDALMEPLRQAQRDLRALTTPSPGNPQCGYCPLPHQCPIASDVRVHGAIQSEEDAERIAGELVVINRAKKHREEVLKDHLGRESDERPVAPVTKSTEGLRKFTDKPPGVPEGVRVKSAKGEKVYAMVASARISSPKQEDVEAAIANARQGIDVDVESLYRRASSSTLRLVEKAVPTDDGQQEEAFNTAIDEARERLAREAS